VAFFAAGKPKSALLAAAAAATWLGLWPWTAAGAAAQDLQAFAARTTVRVLANGWTFILVERPVAPVFSFCTLANVGSAQEVEGITGLAHMFEHMAFKGTEHVGTRDPEGERKAMDAAEAAYQAWQAARLAPCPPLAADPSENAGLPKGDGDESPTAGLRCGSRRQQAKLDELYAELKRREEEAERFVVKNEFDEILSRAGAVGVNAATGSDETEYFYSLPANQIELFAYLESERFFHPVFREFYEERDVVQEERRMRVDGQPQGRLVEQFVSTAFDAHTYHHPSIGYMSDLQAITRTDAEAFFRTYYVPSNMVTAIVGDIHPATLIPLLETYFGRIPARPAPPPLRTVEPPQTAEKTVVLEDPAQPLVLEAYHKPAVTDPDEPVYDAIDDVLSGGRASRLYRSLVRDQRVAVEVESFSGLPGEKYPNLWAVLAVPAVGVSNDRVQAALRREIERLKAEDVSDQELARFKARARGALIHSLGSNLGLATQLAEHQRLFGDWRELFRQLDRVEGVSKADIRRVAARVFRPTNRTTGVIVTREPAAAGAPARHRPS
jgi:predicted Zn-dependent peptidase